MRRIVKAIRQFQIRDFFAPFIFLILFIPSLWFRFYNRIHKRNLWLIAEQGEARDNGYHFYKYIRKDHPNDYCFYAIKPTAAKYKEVQKLGNIIQYGSIKHWLYYMSANLNISSQKSGNPCPIFWYFIHVTLHLYNNRVFLQHGITKDDSNWLYYNKTRFKYFICGAKREYDYILQQFGYSKRQLLLTGFPRWDNLQDTSKRQKRKAILIMPTWREWLGGEGKSKIKTEDFKKTTYYRKWDSVLHDRAFIKRVEQEGTTVYFYPHANMQKFLKSFSTSSENIKIVSTKQDIQKLFNKCNLMITDYSSVAFDFAYLEKPVIYYQFDIKEYRARQYQEGYFEYEKDGFGPIVKDAGELHKAVSQFYQGILWQKYQNRATNFFKIMDKGNCKRVYEALK